MGDVKLTLFSVHDKQCSISVQVLGEARPASASSKPGGASVDIAFSPTVSTCEPIPEEDDAISWISESAYEQSLAYTYSVSHRSAKAFANTSSQTDASVPHKDVRSCAEISTQTDGELRPPILPRDVPMCVQQAQRRSPRRGHRRLRSSQSSSGCGGTGGTMTGKETGSRPLCSSRTSSSGGETGETMSGDEPAVSGFELTPPSSAATSLLWTLKHWNSPRGVICGSCCPVHGQLLQMKGILKHAQTFQCNPLWSSFVDWQCERCKCLNIHQRSECDMCGKTKDSS